MTLIISNCSKRKRAPLDPTLRAGGLAKDSVDAVATAWGERLKAATSTTAAEDLYAGRAFNEAASTASILGARLAIVSAGLGLVDGATLAPGYSLTTARRDPDNILAKTGGSASEWWMSLQARSPYRSTAIEEEGGRLHVSLEQGLVRQSLEGRPQNLAGGQRGVSLGDPPHPIGAQHRMTGQET